MEMVHFIPPGQRRLAMMAAQADAAPVLILGASGTGKGHIAKWIHLNSPRSNKPFSTADRTTPLAQQIALNQGGTLVLNEIGEWPLADQKALLSFLKTRSITHPENPEMRMLVNVRIIATTSQALENRSVAGLFNSDLLKKLNVFRIEMPHLSQRNEEFEDIVQGVLEEISREFHKEFLREISPEAWTILKSHEWKGNIRELRNILRVTVLQAKGPRVNAADLPQMNSELVDYRATREEFEKQYLIEMLKSSNYQIEKTCELSHIDKKTLLAKIQHYGIEIGIQ